MARKKVYGKCQLCGTTGKLTFEHVPPRAAFNDRPTVNLKFEDGLGLTAFDLGPNTTAKSIGKISQRGSGAYALCGHCNNNTGSWYGPAFVNWCYEGAELVEKVVSRGLEPTIIQIRPLHPLRVLKQIAVFFFLLNRDFYQANGELQRFVLNRRACGLPSKYRFYSYYNLSRIIRSWGVVGQVDISGAEPTRTFSEFAFPPYGYVLTLDSPAPDKRLCDITHFAQYRYDDFSYISLQVPLLPVNTSSPGDYRTLREIQKAAEEDGHPIADWPADPGSRIKTYYTSSGRQ